MPKRLLSWMFVLMLLVGGAAACGDDDGGDDDTEEGDDGGGGGGGGGGDIQAYCDAVEEYALAVQDAGTDAAALAELTDEAQALADQAEDFADLAGDDLEAYQDCANQLSEALAP